MDIKTFIEKHICLKKQNKIFSNIHRTLSTWLKSRIKDESCWRNLVTWLIEIREITKRKRFMKVNTGNATV